MVRLPGDFVADVRREAEERGVTLGRVITERAKWTPKDAEQSVVRRTVAPRVQPFLEREDDDPDDEVHEHRFVFSSISNVRKCECGEIQK